MPMLLSTTGLPALSSAGLVMVSTAAPAALSGGYEDAGVSLASAALGPTEGESGHWAAPTGSGTWYYVDGAVASSGAGTSLAAAFKTIDEACVAATTAGDTVVIRGAHDSFDGRYEEAPYVRASGTSSNKITFVRYNDETPIIDGSSDIGTPSACVNGDANSNANWANLKKFTSFTAPGNPRINWNLTQDGTQLVFAGDGGSFDWTDYDDIYEMGSSANYEAYASSTSTSITGTTIGTTSSADKDDAIVLLHYSNGNNIIYRDVTSHSGSTVNFSTHSVTIDASTSYVLVNLPSQIQAEGQWAINAAGTEIYVWPFASKADTWRLSYRKNGLVVDGYDYITIYGLKCEGLGGGGALTDGIAFGDDRASVSDNQGITIEECEATNLCAFALNGTAGNLTSAAFEISRAIDCTIKNCEVTRARGLHGLSMTGSSGSTTYTGNEIGYFKVDYVSGSGIRPHGLYLSQIYYCKVSNINGAHGNGGSIYQGAQKMLMFGCYLATGGGIGWTYQDSTNLYFINCVFRVPNTSETRALENNNEGAVSASGEINVINCSGPPPPGYTSGSSEGFRIGNAENSTTHNAVNNVAHGGIDANLIADAGATVGTQTNNVATALGPTQNSSDSFFTGGGSNTYNTSLTALYADWANADYRPKSGGALASGGTNPTSYFPTSDFPSFDFNRDALGNTVDWTGTVMRGAYQETA